MERVPLDGIPDDQLDLLRDIFDAGLSAATEAAERSDSDRASARAAIYRRLLGAVDSGQIMVPDEQARAVVEEIATATDEENQYSLVVAEHDALHTMLGLLGGDN